MALQSSGNRRSRRFSPLVSNASHPLAQGPPSTTRYSWRLSRSASAGGLEAPGASETAGAAEPPGAQGDSGAPTAPDEAPDEAAAAVVRRRSTRLGVTDQTSQTRPIESVNVRCGISDGEGAWAL